MGRGTILITPDDTTLVIPALHLTDEQQAKFKQYHVKGKRMLFVYDPDTMCMHWLGMQEAFRIISKEAVQEPTKEPMLLSELHKFNKA